ncbi:MAG: 30S ribosomal protein S15 [Dehalococcoidia bacterium]
MGLDKAEKQTVIEEYRLHDKDTGSVESQVAVLSTRITELTQHLREHNHDESTRRGLLKMVGKRKKLLKYLNNKDVNKYRSLISRLGLRR